MSVKTAAVTVTTTATLLNTFPDADGVFGNDVVVCPVADVLVGGSDVSTGNGFPVGAGAVMSFPIKPGDALYALTAAGSTTVKVLATGV